MEFVHTLVEKACHDVLKSIRKYSRSDEEIKQKIDRSIELIRSAGNKRQFRQVILPFWSKYNDNETVRNNYTILMKSTIDDWEMVREWTLTGFSTFSNGDVNGNYR